MTARVHRLLRGSLGSVLGLLGCSFNAVGLGEGEPGVSDGMTTDLSSGSPTSGSQTSGGTPPTSSEGETGGSGEGSTSAPLDPTTTSVDPSTTTGVDPSTTTGVDSSTSTGCVEQSFFKDGDEDGYGDPEDSKMGCEAPRGYVDDNTDCNDDSDKANPGAAEVCGGGDNDCDGLTDDDDPPMNVDCGGCKMFVRDVTLYHFCGASKTWDEAKGICDGRKAVLAKDGDEDVHEWLMDRFTAIDASGPWWLGARTLDGNHANFAWSGLGARAGRERAAAELTALRPV